MLHFPVGHIMDRVLSLFHIVVSDNTHIQAIDNGLKKGIKYVLNDAPVGQPASLTGENVIEVNDNYCEFLYLICYTFLVINDCCLVLTDNVEGEASISKEEAESYCREAGEMLSEALKMLVPNENDEKCMAASRGKLFRFPNTSRPNKYTDFSDSMTIAGLTYVLHHEFGHFIFEHEEDTPFNELDADKHAILHLKKWGEATKYNPQNETCNAHRTKGAKIKTKRAVLTKRSVPSVRFFLSSVDPPFSKKFRPGFAGFCGPAPALPCPALSVYLNGLRMMFGGRSSRLVALRFGSLRDRFLAHATSDIALYAATLCALTRLPRKARREPTCVFEYEASIVAYANETPPYAYA